ncbi:MAG: WYL domain-containing protein, partial [Bacteroidetes bacterium]|nr:WYL domain-containing protein [Bacteroidota bacterium]
MPAHATLHIYALILEKLRTNTSTSLSALNTYLKDFDLGKSERSLARYIEQMRHEFGLDIVYEAASKGYVFKQSDDFEVELFLNFVGLSQTAGIVIGGKKQMKELMPLVQFDSNMRLQGLENLRDLLFAIQNRRYIQFKHTNYHTEKVTEYRIKPILLKQYQHHWYVIGEIKESEYRTFGCDRISSLNVETKTFVAKNNKEVRKKFEQVIGLNYSEGKMEKVKLELTPLQAKYLKASPLHPSQYLESETRDAVVFVLNLIPNYELIQKILMMSDQVKVLAPASLRFEVKKHLLST